jgi:hypothetical protein
MKEQQKLRGRQDETAKAKSRLFSAQSMIEEFILFV